MPNIMIELSNRTTEVMAENLVLAFAQYGVEPTVYRVLPDGTVKVKSGYGDISKLNIVSRFYSDSYRPPWRGLVGTRLYKAMVETGCKDFFDAFVIFNDGGGHKRVIAEWGRRNNVPVFYIPESAGAIRGLTPHSYFSLKFKMMAAVEQLLFPLGASMAGEGLVAQYVCAPNQEFADWLESITRKTQTVMVTGSPLYDRVAFQTTPSEPPNYKVMFIHQPMIARSKRYQSFVRAFFDISRLDPRPSLLFKVHPRTSKSEMDLILQMVKTSPVADRIEIVTTGDARTMMRDIGALVTGGSTVINDAVLAGIPIVLLKEAFSDGIDAYLDIYGAAISVHQPEELNRAVTKALFDAQTRSALNKAVVNRVIPEYFSGLDGKASQRIALLVLERLCEPIVSVQANKLA